MMKPLYLLLWLHVVFGGSWEHTQAKPIFLASAATHTWPPSPPSPWGSTRVPVAGQAESPEKTIAGSLVLEQCAAHGLLPARPEFLLEMTDAESAEARLTNPRADLEHAAQ